MGVFHLDVCSSLPSLVGGRLKASARASRRRSAKSTYLSLDNFEEPGWDGWEAGVANRTQ